MAPDRNEPLSFWTTTHGAFLLQYLTPRREPVIVSKPHMGRARLRRRRLPQHQWLQVGSLTAGFRSRCPHCGVVREYDTRGRRTWVSYSTYGEFLAHGELGMLEEPVCEPDPQRSDWDMLGAS